MATLTIDFNIEFEKIPTDLSTCAGCKEVVYGNTFTVVCVMETDREIKRIPITLDFAEIKLCESCCDVIRPQK